LTYQFPGFTIETRNAKHQTDRLKIFFLLKWSKSQKCERPNETGDNKP